MGQSQSASKQQHVDMLSGLHPGFHPDIAKIVADYAEETSVEKGLKVMTRFWNHFPKEADRIATIDLRSMSKELLFKVRIAPHPERGGYDLEITGVGGRHYGQAHKEKEMARFIEQRVRGLDSSFDIVAEARMPVEGRIGEENVVEMVINVGRTKVTSHVHHYKANGGWS